MGHGAWMGITWGNVEDGWMKLKIALETLHVLVGYVWGAWAARPSKCALGCPSKLDMFQWVVARFRGFCFKAHVSRHAISNQQK